MTTWATQNTGNHIDVQQLILTTDYAEMAWDLYERTMRPLAILAAQRHMLTRPEFGEALSDPRIQKHLAWVGGKLVGFGVATDHLEAWPLISPDYYRHRFPGRQIWYIGFVVVAPKSLGVLAPLIRSLSAPAREAGGVAAADFCTYNLDTLKIGDRIDSLLRYLDPSAQLAAVNVQEFRAWTFEGK